MKLGKNSGKIIDYGTTISKMGSAQVFIRVRLDDGDESTWYGVAIKKDGESNDIMLQQLAYCGFDPAKDSIEDLAGGPDSGLLVMDEDIDIYCSMQLNKVGEDELRISSIGPIGPNRADATAIKAAITDEQAAKIKASASKFKVRERKAVVPKAKQIKTDDQNPEEALPF